ELDPEAPIPPIVMTRGDTGEGIEELKSEIEGHRRRLEDSGELEKRRRASLREFVVSWATGRLEREIKERLAREDAKIMEEVYARRLDPISASERIFREV